MNIKTNDNASFFRCSNTFVSKYDINFERQGVHAIQAVLRETILWKDYTVLKPKNKRGF